jgi:hypothetical protein
MPFSKGTVPDRLKGKNIPQKYVNQFIDVFNSVLDKTSDEGAAYRQAYGVMNKALHKDGYRQGTDGKWHKGGKRKKESLDEMPLLEEFVVAPMVRASRIVLEEKTLDAALAEGLTFEGVALVDHAVSQLGTGFERYYSPEFNDQCLSRTNAYMESGHIATVYNSHGSALGGFFTMSTEDPIGKLVEKLKRVGDEIHYKAHITPTDEGRNNIKLLYDGVRLETSVRIYEHVSESCELLDKEGKGTGEFIYNMTDGYIGGIDFCDEAGIAGAGVKRILESKPAWVLKEVEDNMDWSEITLAELKAQRPDVLQEYTAPLIEAAKAQGDEAKAELETAKASVAELGTENAALKTDAVALTEKVTTLEATVTSLNADLALERAAQFGISKAVAEQLRAAKPSAEELAAKAKELWENELTKATAEVQAAAKGNAQPVPKPDVGDEGYATVEMDEDQLDDIRKIFGYAH